MINYSPAVRHKTKKMKVETTKENVLKAAKELPMAKDALKILYPECFEGEEFVTGGELNDIRPSTRAKGRYKYRSFFLSSQVNWEIVKDEHDNLCLVPTRKL